MDKIRAAKKIAKVTAGVTVGTSQAVVGFGMDVYNCFRRDSEFDALYSKISYQAREYEDLRKQLDAIDKKQKRIMILDSIGLGTCSFFEKIIGHAIPVDVQEAYQLAYPNLAAQESIQDAVLNMDDEQLVGFANGIKGKLFEVKYLDYLNDGHLPTGYTAELANSPTQPGWDIVVHDANGDVAQELQLKATESAEYIEHALDKYPYIDIVSTDEVFSHVTMGDISAHVINSGISNEELSTYVNDQVMAAHTDSCDMIFPSVIPYLIIVYSVSRSADSLYKKGKEAGSRSLTSYVCHALGITVSVATHTWWVAPVVSVGTRIATGYGHQRKLSYQKLKQYVKQNDKILRTMKKKTNAYA
jgi:hypothetical protein